MRTGKTLGMIIGGLIALMVIALLAVWLLVNPNDYKPRIAAAVKDATGRELVLQGDIKLSVFPWIALELGPAS
ncbi:MAG: AsmA family protein, partial [Gammaproteobacteria bacterium]|nr:AsmA family protein [Gammaproteobacteria bacterium]